MASKTSPRQRLRRALLLASLMLFPLTLNYFSPYLIVDASARGIVNASLLVFAAMFLGSLVVGRLWCGWLCPAGGLQEALLPVNRRRPGRRAGLVKWFIWIPWIVLIAAFAIRAGGYHSLDPLFGTVGGISVAGDADRPIAIAYAIYFGVIALFFGLAAGLGRRAGCHSVCWMAPFMIAGRGIRNRVGWPALQLKSDPSACKRCGTCTNECPMGLEVAEMVASDSMEHRECVLCGTCVDSCPSKAIAYSFGRPSRRT